MAASSQVTETSRPTFQGGSTGSNPVGATSKSAGQRRGSLFPLLGVAIWDAYGTRAAPSIGVKAVRNLVRVVLIWVPVAVERKADRRVAGPNRHFFWITLFRWHAVELYRHIPDPKVRLDYVGPKAEAGS